MQRAKSNESNPDDFEFRDDPSNNQIEYHSKENSIRNTINPNKGNVYLKSKLSNISIEMNHVIQSKMKKNTLDNNEKYCHDNELHIEIDDTFNDSNNKKYFTSKNRKRIKIEFIDQNLENPQFVKTINSVNKSNKKENRKEKKEKYSEIPNKSDGKQTMEYEGECLNVSKDIQIEVANHNKVVIDDQQIDKNIKKDYSIEFKNNEEGNNQIIMNEVNKKTEGDLSTLTTYCSNCFIDIPLRAKHCKICNKCIATLDHHCSWVGNCIGEKNKRLFIIFLTIHSITLGSGIVVV
jgi:hypothetical protein